MKDSNIFNVLYEDELEVNDIKYDIVNDLGGGAFFKDINTIVISHNAGDISIITDPQKDSSGKIVDFGMKEEIVKQNTTSVLFHEIGEVNEKNIHFRGSVVDYENKVRVIIKLPLRPTDLNHSHTVKTNYAK